MPEEKRKKESGEPHSDDLEHGKQLNASRVGGVRSVKASDGDDDD